ncbi:MAG TPA: signal peptidase I [Polyangiaceae bacterium]|nr:signal peptidase I [Polyangiaceae bacterium]HMR76815.1 signal peptidase I [Polyangiaceae bacterium]
MRKVLRFLLWTAIIVGAIVGVARAVAIRWWTVPLNDPYLEASIAPSLRGGDTIILWRLTKPKFGDLVVCPEPDAPERVVIGRIIAEVGDNVAVEGQTVQVNDRAAATEEACNAPKFTVLHPTTRSEIEQGCSMEVLGGHLHMRGGVGGHGLMPRSVKTKVEPGKVFLLSDNRLLPYDSRDFGQVDVNTCTETVVFRLVSAKGFFDVESRLTFIQ